VAQAVVPQLEAVQVQKEHQALVAAHGVQGLLRTLVEHGAVGQARERVVISQLPDAVLAGVALHGHGAQVQAGQHQLAVQLVRAARGVEVEVQRADDPAFVVLDRVRPAGLQACAGEQGGDGAPVRILGNVGGHHFMAEVGGRGAGTVVGTGAHALHELQHLGRDAGRSQRVQQAAGVHVHDADLQPGNHLLQRAAHVVQQVGQGLFHDHVFQHLALQSFEAFGEADVGQHDDLGRGADLGEGLAVEGVDRGRDPQGAAVFAAQQQLARVGAVLLQLVADVGRQLRVLSQQLFQRPLPLHVLQAVTQQTRKTFVDMGHAQLLVGDEPGTVAAV